MPNCNPYSLPLRISPSIELFTNSSPSSPPISPISKEGTRSISTTSPSSPPAPLPISSNHPKRLTPLSSISMKPSFTPSRNPTQKTKKKNLEKRSTDPAASTSSKNSQNTMKSSSSRRPLKAMPEKSPKISLASTISYLDSTPYA
jgi:hypothetical protein